MAQYLILAQSTLTSSALSRVITVLRHEPTPQERVATILWEPFLLGRERGPDFHYQEMVRRIEDAVGSHVLSGGDFVILVDCVRPSLLNPLANEDSWEPILAMLILTFPEVRWVFGSIVGEAAEFPTAGHCVASLFSAQRDPLFDPTGLREWVRHRCGESLQALGDDLVLPGRSKTCAAIDEEPDFAYLHAYTAYRFGLRTDVITTWASMIERFSLQGKSHGYWLLFEDMSLNFSDREAHLSLLQLKDRAGALPSLNSHDPDAENSHLRILVTTGQARPGETSVRDNQQYLRQKAAGRGRIVFKPAGGMFDLWKQVGLLGRSSNTTRAGNVPGFEWPPQMPRHGNQGRGHGCPGKLMLIAQNLLRRAEVLNPQSTQVLEAVRCAVLATDALELTGGRTPTTAIEALALKHQFELLAECQFSGIQYHISTRPRLREIAFETTAVCRWFHKKQRRKATLNSEMRIINGLVGIVRERNLFDEEQAYLIQVRRLHNTLWMAEKPFRVLMWPVLRYLELLLSSFAVFVVVVLVWISLLSVLFAWAGHHPKWAYGVADAVTSFFSVGGPIHPAGGSATGITEIYATIICVAIVSGALHIGVLISHLYSLVMKR